MDQLNAHLDRAWDLLTRGDLRGARQSARRALSVAPDSPEVYALLGHVAHREGESEEALEHFEHAMSLDELYLDPILGAAEVHLALEEFEDVIGRCDDVIDMADEPQVVADALLLKFEAMFLRGDDLRACRAVLDGVPAGPYENPQMSYLLGRAWYDLGEHARALPLLDEAIVTDPQNSDAWYFLGLVREAQRDLRGATLAWVEVRALDLKEPRPTWALSLDAFGRVLTTALESLDGEAADTLREAMVMTLDVPPIELLADGVDPRVPLLFEGLDRPGDPPPPPDAVRFVRLFVYQRNAERMMPDPAEAAEVLAELLRSEFQRALRGELPDAGLSVELPLSVRAAEVITPGRSRKSLKPPAGAAPTGAKEPEKKPPTKPRKKGS